MVTETQSFDITPAFLTLAVFPHGPAATVSLAPLANYSEVASSESLIAAPRAPRLDEDEDDDLEEEDDVDVDASSSILNEWEAKVYPEENRKPDGLSMFALLVQSLEAAKLLPRQI